MILVLLTHKVGRQTFRPLVPLDNCTCMFFRERSGSVVECLTQDRRAAGSSLTGVTALVLEQDTFILA